MVHTSLFFSPNAPCYAVIRMDPIAMVKDLDDSEAMAAARTMTPQSYVVYLTHEPALPFPNKPWYRYELNVIAPSLCEEDVAKGITADMCTPIYPNEKHPAGREPLRPENPFPYTNCYHWCNTLEIEIRVLARPELFNEDQAIKLSYDEQMRFSNHQFADLLRSRPSLSSLMNSPTPPPIPPLPRTETNALSPAVCGDPSHEKPPSRTLASSRSSSMSSASRSVISGQSDLGSVDRIMAMDIFSGSNRDLDLLPLCELWLDMASQLKQEDIPSPTGLFEERDEIVRIIQDARVRAYAAMHAAGSPPSAREVHRHDADASVPSQSPVERKRRYFRPRKVWRKLHARVTSLASSRF